MAALAPAPTSLVDLIQQVTTPGANLASVAQTLRTFAPADVREIVLAGLLPGPQDPLALLDVRAHTLPLLFILSARLVAAVTGGAGGAPPVDIAYVNQFCAAFDVEQARAAPERVTQLAKAIVVLAETIGAPTAAIHPVHSLLTRFAPDLSYLTPIHPIFVTTCLKHLHAPPALLRPILEVPISEISTALFPDLHYTDNLVYHYVGGIIYGQWKEWFKAEEFFEICVGSPAQTPSAVQWDALKKLVLIQCISRGKTMPLPKYMHPALARILKNSPYSAFTKKLSAINVTTTRPR
jgi:COP9 signalosome complex subunit 3